MSRDPVDIIERAYLALDVEQQRAVKARLRRHKLPKPRKRSDRDYIPNAPLRAAVLERINRGEMTMHDLGRAVGCPMRGTRLDTSTLRRRLGVTSHKGRYWTDGVRREYRTTMKRISIPMALKIVDALGLDPVDFDL